MKRLNHFLTSIVLSSLLFFGCSNKSDTDSRPTEPPEIGVAGDGNLQANLEYIRNQNNVPALAAITIHGGEIVDIAAAGLRADGHSEKVTIEDKWHTGSITKSMTSILAAVLVEQGTISWETTIADVFPSLVGAMRSEYETVRLDELLSHTSGLDDNAIDDEFLLSFITNTAPLPAQRRQAIEEVLNLASDHLRSTYKYSNIGYVVAGAMLEAVTGKSWEELIQTNVFAPLGMNSTGFGAPGTSGQRNQPWGHLPNENGWRAIDPSDLEADFPAVLGPAGTVHSTMNDIALYMAAHLAGARGNDGLVTKESFEKLHTPFPGTQYALGWLDLGGGILWHNGGNERWYAQLFIMPEVDGAFFMVTNVGEAEGGDTVTSKVSEITLKRFRAAFDGTN